MPRKPIADSPMAEMPAEMPPISQPVKKVVRRARPKMPAASPAPAMMKSESSGSRRRSRQPSSGALFIFLLVIVIVLVGAYFATTYFKNKSAQDAALQEQAAAEAQAQANSADNATTTPEAPVDPTASWLVFNYPISATSTAPSVGMTFKYPGELQLTQNSDNIILSNAQVTSTQVNIYWVKSKKSLKDYLTAMDKVNATGWEGQPSTTIATSTDAVMISGYPAVFRQQKLLAADLNQYITYVKASSTIFAISLAAPQLDQNLLAFFVTFLNNFKLGQ